MATTQTFETIIKLNSQEARNNLEQLRKKVDDLKAARDKAIQSKADSSFVKDINKDLKAARSELRSYEANVSNTIKTVENLSSSSVKDVKKAMRALKQEMDKTTDPEDYVKLQAQWELCKQRVDEFSRAVELSETRVKSLENVMNNIKNASLNDLTGASNTLQSQLAGMNPESTDYKSKAANLAAVRQRIDEINASQKAANTTIDKYNQEILQATAKSSDLKRENELIDRTLKNISGSTMRDLEYSLKLVNEQLRGTEQGTEEYEKLTKSAKQLKTQIAAINDEQKEYSRTYRCCHRYCSRSSADCHYQETASDAGGYRILRGWFHRWQELSPGGWRGARGRVRGQPQRREQLSHSAGSAAYRPGTARQYRGKTYRK